MAWKWNPFTNNLDYYQVSSGSGGSSFTLTHVTNFSALPDPTTVGLYDVFIVDNSQGNRFWYGSIGGTYYPSGAYYSDLTKWIYSESASKATQAEVDAGTDIEKYVTPETLNNYDRWATLLKKSANIVTVDTTAGVGDFTSIAAAVASITTASLSNPFVVRVNAGLYLEPVITMKSWITVKGDSSMNTIVEASSSSNSVFMMADQSMIIDLQIQGSTGTGVSAVVYSSPTVPQTNAIAYAENVRFGANYTHAKTIGTGSGNCILQCSNVKYGGYPFTLGFHVTNDGSGVGRMQLRNVTSTNGGVTTTTGLIFAKADQPNCAFIVNGCLLTKATGVAAGTGFWVENGGSLRLTAVNFQRWATAIYAPNTGLPPSIYGTALNFENNTKDVTVEHLYATGKFEGTDTFLKTAVPIAAPIYEINKDPRIITVAKKGGNFTSIAAAVDFITDSSTTNRYIIQVGPGVFTEPVIDLASHPYVSLIGASIETTQIAPDSSTHDIILLGANNEVSFLTLQNAGVGYAGLLIDDAGDYSQAHKISFEDCSIGISILSATQDTLFYGEYIDFNGIYDYGVKVISSNGFSAFANLENYYNFPTGSLTAGTWVSGPNAEVKVVGSGHTSGGLGIAFQLVDGALLTLLATYIDYFNIGIYIENTGAASNAIITSLDVDNSTTWDLFIEHPTASGTFNGSADHTKINNVSSNFAWAYLDSNDAQFEITGKLAITYPTGEHTEVSTLLLEGGTMGLIEGGALTNGGGFIVNIASGFGYYELTTGTNIILRKDWTNTSIPLVANEDKYIYFDNTGALESNGSQPDSTHNIVLGRVVTNGVGIELIDEVPTHAQHTSNKFDKLFRNAMGPIYASGSQVSENITPFHLNINGGSYYYASNEFNPVGGNNILFTPTLNGVAQTAIQIVLLSWDNAGTLTSLTTGEYAKHSLYVVGDGANEKYYLVYGQTTFASLSAAEAGIIPLPPTFVKDAVTLIAGIIVTFGASSISGIIDQRPVIGFKASGSTGSSDHLSLSNLLTGDAGHTQFLMLDGSKPMGAALNMNTHAISNITTLNGILPADWFKKGGNAYGADTIIGLTDAYNLNIRTNNLTRLGIASSGEVTVGNLTGLASGVIGATTTGQLTRSVSTTNLTEGTNLYFTDAKAIAALLTGYTSLAGTITASDSILSAIGKLNGNVDALSVGAGVTSVGLTMPSAFTVSNSPITSAGDIAVTGSGTITEYIRGDGTLATLPTTTSTVSHNVKYGEAITIGQAVYVSSADGTNMIVSKASNTSEATSSKTMGLVTATGATNYQGVVITEGLLAGLNTSTATVGDAVWLGANGDLIFWHYGGSTSKPVAPDHLVFIGIVTRVNAINGEIFVKVQNGYEVDELHDVSVVGRVDNSLLGYVSSTGLHVFKTIADWIGYTPANKAGETFTGAISATNLSGTNTGDETITTIKSKLGITTLSGSNTGDQDLSGLVVKNATIVGATNTKITYDSKGLVTSGTNATTADIADTTNKRYTTDAQQTILGNTSNTNSGDETTGTIQTKLGAATTALDGYLTSTDWNTFYGKQASLGYTPVNKAGDTMSSYLILNADPVASLGAATKQYVDNLASGINFHSPAHAATTINLVANYTNGTGGVNAKLTATTDGALIVDNHTMLQYERLLVWQQSNAFENGVYDVTATGDSTHPFELTRSTDADNNPSGEIAYGDFLFVQKGDTYGGVGFVVNTAGTINIGSTNISYVQFNAAQIVAAGYGLQELTPNVLSVDTSLIQTKLSAATSSVDGYLTSTDWGIFNGKQNALSGTGFIKISGTTVSYDNSTYQPLDTDLTAIAALTTDPFGLDLLTKSDASSIRSYIGVSSGGDALTTNPLSQFASTTSAELAGVISDETGTGSVVFSDSPALTGTPTAPTATPLTNTTQVATTEYVDTALSALGGDFIPAPPVPSYPQGYYANNGSATLSIMGNVSSAALSGTASLNSIVGTNTLTRTVRITIPTSSTAGSKAGVRTAALRHSVGQGFLFSVCWAIQDAAYVAGAKQFHGLLPISTLSTINNLINVESLTNFVGIGSDAADLNLQIFHSAGGATSKIDLGPNFPANRTAGAVMNNVYVFEMYNAPGSTSVRYRLTERSSGNTTQGEITTNLPDITVLMGSQSIRTNGASTLATVTQWQHLIGYII